MSRLEEAVVAAAQIETMGMKPTEPSVQPFQSIPPQDPIAIRRDIFLRCPMPFIASSPDSLRQFYRDGIPQMRVTPLAQL